jgi:hypothetical protein
MELRQDRWKDHFGSHYKCYSASLIQGHKQEIVLILINVSQ